MTKSCFYVQKKDIGKWLTLFRRYFIANRLGQCWYAENVSFRLNNHEICDKMNIPMNFFACVRFIAKFTSCNGLKYQKIRYKSRGNNPIKPFQFHFTCVLISYFFYKQIMASGTVPPQRREVVVRGDRNCFYRVIALWRDEMTDEKHEEIRRLSSTLIQKNRRSFSRHCSLRTLWGTTLRKARSWELGKKLST